MLITELRKNTEVLEMLFDSYGLNVTSFGYEISGSPFYWITAFVEIMSKGEINLSGEYDIKINMYDEEGNILCSENGRINGDEFKGFETVTIYIQTENIAIEAKKARIFITKY
ncbi:MAG: hypothetical protein FWB87_10790 [Defluviitaleaceae bacterium]|nr:hypothetical protein [Defluviitaleaceae bacterium]MCL2261988.1 hypothetical protein [Defluviitaleaceae bacterium]